MVLGRRSRFEHGGGDYGGGIGHVALILPAGPGG
jgi:hypothetical protein